MPDRSAFDDTFATLRDILQRHEKGMTVLADKPGDYQLGAAHQTDRTGRPLWAAAVQIKKNYVSYHLMPVYASPELLTAISPSLKKRMQGKACFNFTTIDAAQVKELSALTKAGFERFKTIKLPW
jgi:hypothetical protein